MNVQSHDWRSCVYVTLYRIKGTFSETETTTTGEIYYTTDIFYTTTLLYYIILCSGVIYIYIYIQIITTVYYTALKYTVNSFNL